MADTLTATMRTVMIWDRTVDQDIGTTVTANTDQNTYRIADGSGSQQADLVYAANRTIAANTLEQIDVRAITQTTLGVTVNYDFRQLRLVRVVNNETTSGRKIRVGCDPGRPTVAYAVEIGPGSEWFTINHINAWPVTTANQNLYIANPNAASVSYSLWLVGTSVAAT